MIREELTKMATDTKNASQTTSCTQYLRHTKIPTLLFQNAKEVDKHVALIVEGLIRENNSAGLPTVLGLPTGSTPIGVYRELIRLHHDEDLDFSRVVTFNLDEYWPMDHNSIHSYNRWMRETFFDHVNISEGNIHIPRGDIPRQDVEAFCDDYERAIERAGGIQLQLLGIGRTGHVGFNEPGSPSNSLTRMVTLDPVTRLDASGDFFGEENVPENAITMGVGSIMSARKIIAVALGEHKAPVVRRAVEGEVTHEIAASNLQNHPNAIFAVDLAAANQLTAVATPWMVGPVDWTSQLEKRAVIWLSEQTEKPILKLELKDFLENHLHELAREFGPLEGIRHRVFQELLDGICTIPAGQDRKKIIVFSPHPDDDVISMGGTLITLADQGHDVNIAYMTSGNIAVFDHDARRHIEFMQEFQRIFNLESDKTKALNEKMLESIRQKAPGDPDIDELLEIKTLIRMTEATVAAKTAGVPAKKLHFLDLPFYRTGEVIKRPVGEEDVTIIAELLQREQPDQIYVAGDLSDPHGTHRLCAHAILRALDRIKDELNPQVWLYRGAWQDYEPHEVDMAVPLSPETMLRKKQAIFKHESQKDSALFPGHDDREFWIRAENRNKNMAQLYNLLGLPEYFGLEAFVKFSSQI